MDVEEESESKEGLRRNIFNEKKLLRTYNRCFMGEMTTYIIFFGAIAYFGASYVTGTFSVRAANSLFICPGLLSTTGSYYGRHYHLADFEEDIREAYGPDVDKYEKFFRDDGY